MTDATTPEAGMPHPSPANPADPSDLPNPSDLASPSDLPKPSDPADPSDIVRISLAGLNGTGDARVDEAVAQLGRLDDAPLEQHPVILGQVHDRLREVLGELSPGDTPRGPGDTQRAPGTP